MYKCDSKCYEFNNGHICRHIHKVHSLALACGKTVCGTESQQMCQVNDAKAISMKDEGEGYGSSDDDHTLIAYAESVDNPNKGLSKSSYLYLVLNQNVFKFTSILDHTMQLKMFSTSLHELQSHVTTANDKVLPYLAHINALLHQALATCKAASKSDSLLAVSPLVTKDVIPSGKSIQHQWRFKKSVKPPGKRKRGSILR